MRYFVIFLNAALLLGFVAIISSEGFPRIDADLESMALIVIMITPIFNLYYLITYRKTEGLLSLLIKRKVLEEKAKINELSS